LFPESICNFFKINNVDVFIITQEIINVPKSNLDLVLSLWDRDHFCLLTDTCRPHCFWEVPTLTWFRWIASSNTIEVVEVLKWLIF
jgi:hypothetical protein